MKNRFEPTRERFAWSATAWFRWYSFWLWLHYIAGLLIVVFSAVVASGNSLLGIDIKIYGALAGIIAAGVTFLRPNEKAAFFRARWHLLNSAMLDPENDDVSKLYKAYILAENMSSGVVLEAKKDDLSDG